MLRRASRLPLVLIVLLTLGSDLRAHAAPGSSTFDLLIPGDAMNSSLLFATLIGPPAGLDVLHVTWNLSFVSPPGGTPASEVHLEIGLPVNGALTYWSITGADLGWPAANGSFSGSLGSDQLNGVLSAGPLGVSLADLHIFAAVGGVTGQFVASTIQVELADRTVCQQDLGFGGPGSLTISLCGEELAHGGQALLDLQGGPASATAFLLLSGNATPVPFKGGVLVPIPILLVLALPTAVDGSSSLAVPGGGGPLTVYVQAAAPDGGLPLGYALSNALQVELLP